MTIKVKSTRNGKPERAAPKKDSNYHHGALRDALIHAAREILESQGYEALTLRAAARRVGVSQAAPYNHFADKAALLARLRRKDLANSPPRCVKKWTRKWEPWRAERDRHCIRRLCNVEPGPIQADVRLQRPPGVWRPGT